MGKANKQRKISHSDNYIYLLVALMLLFFISAVAAELGLEILLRLMAVSLTVIVLVAVWSLERNRFPMSSRVFVTLLFVLVEGAEFFFGHFNLGTLQLTSIMIFTVGTIVVAARQVLLTGAVDVNKIIGSICIFLLLGLAWGEAYLLVERLFPGSIPALSGDNWRDHVGDALYFSYVTLTTLGYGDIGPVRPLARYLAYMQAVVGQFYIAIVVASLIGAKMSDGTRNT